MTTDKKRSVLRTWYCCFDAMALHYTAETVSDELADLANAGEFYDPAEIVSKADGLIARYVSHLQRRVLFVRDLVAEVRFRVLAGRHPTDGGVQGGLVKGWKSTGLVTDEKISEILTLMKGRVHAGTPPPRAPSDSTADKTSGSKGKESQRVSAPVFSVSSKLPDWVVVRAFPNMPADC